MAGGSSSFVTLCLENARRATDDVRTSRRLTLIRDSRSRDDGRSRFVALYNLPARTDLENTLGEYPVLLRYIRSRTDLEMPLGERVSRPTISETDGPGNALHLIQR